MENEEKLTMQRFCGRRETGCGRQGKDGGCVWLKDGGKGWRKRESFGQNMILWGR
jgi:hypothetical protein